MDEHRDIYQKPEEDKKRDSLLPAYELTPDQVRTRTRQQVVVFTVIMIGFLAAAALYFYLQEAGQKKSKFDEALNLPVPPPRPPAPEPAATPAPAPEEPEPPPADISPQKMADAMTALRAANAHLLASRFDQAEAGARKALEIWPQMNAALRMLGVIYVQRGQVDQAIAVLEKALKGDPFNTEALNALATAYMQKRMFPKAEESLLTALQIQPDFANAHMNLGLLYVVMGRYDQAVDNFEEAAKKLPNDVNLLNNMGVSYLRLNRYDDARAKFLRMIDLAPDTSAAYFNVAISFTLEGDYPTAMEWIKKGAGHCDPATAQTFLNDGDFDKLRNFPAFQQFVKSLYPDWTAAPGI